MRGLLMDLGLMCGWAVADSRVDLVWIYYGFGVALVWLDIDLVLTWY
jgi:hypothetical protein